MGYIDHYDADFSLGRKGYKIKIKGEQDEVTEIPVESVEEFADLVTMLGREKVLLDASDRSIVLIPRLARA